MNESQKKNWLDCHGPVQVNPSDARKLHDADLPLYSDTPLLQCTTTLFSGAEIYNLRLSQTYGSETWNLTKALERKLRNAHRGMDRIMLGKAWIPGKSFMWRQKKTNFKIFWIVVTRKNK